MMQCRICESKRLSPFLHRGQVPVHQNLVFASNIAARLTARGELDLVVCEGCGFIFNQAFDPGLVAYGEGYDNTQSCSPFFDAYLDGLVKDLVERQGVVDCTIVEVGCGKGDFLHKLVGFPNSRNRGIGFDPSYAGPEMDLDGRLAFRQCYYDDSCAKVSADIVVCRHVIEHVPEPMVLLRSVRKALAGSQTTRVFFETPCAEWILRNRVIWDFFYEHCSLFTEDSLKEAFQRSGFTVERVETLFGGQYLWLEARVTETTLPVILHHPETPGLARCYALEEAQLRRKWLDRLCELATRGKVALWGAGAKGATFANLIDPDACLVDCVVDLNPNKQGCYIPGTGHPIVSPADLTSRGIQSAILMNPNYLEENRCLLAKFNMTVDLIDWSES